MTTMMGLETQMLSITITRKIKQRKVIGIHIDTMDSTKMASKMKKKVFRKLIKKRTRMKMMK